MILTQTIPWSDFSDKHKHYIHNAQKSEVNQMELKPCPFCGAPMNTDKTYGLFGWHKQDCFFVYLDEHETDMYEEEIFPAFVEAWNRRTD